MKPIRITVDELHQDPQRYLTLAKQQLVTIVYEGKDEWVLLSMEEYACLRQASETIALPVEGLSEADLAKLERSEIPEETRKLNALLPKDW